MGGHACRDSSGRVGHPLGELMVRGVLKCLLLLVIALILLPLTGILGTKLSDYQQELGKIRQDIAAELRQAGRIVEDPQSTLRRAYLYYLQASLTGDPKDMAQAGTEIGRSVRESPFAEAYLLQASFYLKRHRLDQAKVALESIPGQNESSKLMVLRADIAIQEGNYAAAESGLKSSLESNRKWDTLSRLAYLRWKAGDFDGADRLYIAAEEEISAKEMRAFAWVALQRGLMALNRGRFKLAEDHYRRAEKAYSGYWLVLDYRAELLGAERRFEAAVAAYQALIACTKRPEFYQALGDLYSFMGQPEQARPWHDKALGVYLDLTRRGEIQYYHHLATLFADARQDGDQAVKWARLDLKSRTNAATLDTLAWALYRKGQYFAALEEMQKSLASGWQDAHLFFHAGMIHLAAGRTEQGKAWLKRAAEINPHYDRFHVHR